jgi:hypothetical protein
LGGLVAEELLRGEGVRMPVVGGVVRISSLLILAMPMRRKRRKGDLEVAVSFLRLGLERAGVRNRLRRSPNGLLSMVCCGFFSSYRSGSKGLSDIMEVSTLFNIFFPCNDYYESTVSVESRGVTI